MHTFTDKGSNAQLYHMQMRGLADKRTWENAIETARERAVRADMRAIETAERAEKEALARALERKRADQEAERADRLLELLRQNGLDPGEAVD